MKKMHNPLEKNHCTLIKAKIFLLPENQDIELS